MTKVWEPIEKGSRLLKVDNVLEVGNGKLIIRQFMSDPIVVLLSDDVRLCQSREVREIKQTPPFQLSIGMKFYGYCNGFFHADYYSGSKTVVAFAASWIVAVEEDGYPNFAYFEDGWMRHANDMIEWMKKDGA